MLETHKFHKYINLLQNITVMQAQHDNSNIFAPLQTLDFQITNDNIYRNNDNIYREVDKCWQS
jgi:hypothetical protein